MRKTRAAYRIRQNLVLENTAPERFVQKILDELQIVYRLGETVNIFDGFAWWISHPDALIESRPCKVIIEVDGPYHQTKIQARKTRWRNAALNEKSYRVVHIPSELCCSKFRDYLVSELVKALASPDMVVNIVA